MTEPVTESAKQPPDAPATTVVEWGNERQRSSVLDRLGGWRHPGIPWALAGLGAVAMFGSLAGEWQVVGDQPDPITGEPTGDPTTVPIGLMLVWGPFWLIGATLLAICGVLALAGRPPLRPIARMVGLATAGVLLGMLVGAAMSLTQDTLFTGVGPDLELSLGRGVYAAFGSVLLIGAALFVVRSRPVLPARPSPSPSPSPSPAPPVPGQATGADPDDLAVGPAEPLVRPTDDQGWR